MPHYAYKTIDLFAGIGGIRLGFEQAFGECLKTVFVSEWDSKAQQTYQANFDEPVDIAGDIIKGNRGECYKYDLNSG